MRIVTAVMGAGVLALLGACNGNRHAVEPIAGELYVHVPWPDSVRAEDRTLGRALIARGDSVYHGRVALGTCASCHGNDLRGGPITPDLTDGDWSHIDGTYNAIVALVATGVPDYDPPMPPLGGAPLSTRDVEAVAAYVFWRAQRGAELRQQLPREHAQ